jgi:hypothetical protein
LISIGFGREKIDCPDLRAPRQNNAKMESKDSVLSHHCRQSSKLQNVPCDQKEGIEYFLFLAACSAFRECQNEQCQSAKGRKDDIDHVKW